MPPNSQKARATGERESAMPKKKFSFKLKSRLSELDKLCRNLETFGRKAGLSKKCIFEINLALDELFTNIISYGFCDDEDHLIKITIAPQNETLCLCIEDDGVPFNPVEFNEPVIQCNIEECKIGGLGIHIIKNLMDEVCYERCRGKNIITLKKHIAAADRS
jgi:serine/threonine-protein kinase RsbW